jgi:hypothetical protein
MWFVNFVLIVTVLITSLVLGWATYLERSASAPRLIEAVPLAHAEAEINRSAFTRIRRDGTRGDAEGEGGISQEGGTS